MKFTPGQLFSEASKRLLRESEKHKHARHEGYVKDSRGVVYIRDREGTIRRTIPKVKGKRARKDERLARRLARAAKAWGTIGVSSEELRANLNSIAKAWGTIGVSSEELRANLNSIRKKPAGDDAIEGEYEVVQELPAPQEKIND